MNPFLHLYRVVSDLRNERSSLPNPSLEVYLRSLWFLARAWDGEMIPVDKLGEWFRAAFSTEAPAFDDAWRSIPYDDYDSAISPRKAWEQLILFQIADLRRMEDEGMLDNEFISFGIDSPTGVQWYNFAPFAFLECAVRACLDNDDEASAFEQPDEGGSTGGSEHFANLTWDDFTDILWLGMSYE